MLRGGADNESIMDKAGTDKLLGQGGKDRLNAKYTARRVTSSRAAARTPSTRNVRSGSGEKKRAGSYGVPTLCVPFR